MGKLIFAIFFLASVPALADAQGALDTDRPGLLFATSTVGRGLWQLEIGAPWVEDEAAGVETRVTTLVTAVRYGLGENLELRLGVPLWSRVDVEDGFGRIHDTGSGDVEVGLKWRLPTRGVALVLIPSVVLPVGQEGFSNEEPIATLNATASWALPAGWSAKTLVGGRRGETAAGETLAELSAAALLAHALPWEGWSAYAEAGWTEPEGGSSSALAGAGMAWLVDDDIQLDLSFQRGLTAAAADWRFEVGFALRFPRR